MNPGIVPDELKGLTQIDQLLIAQIRHAELWWGCSDSDSGLLIDSDSGSDSDSDSGPDTITL